MTRVVRTSAFISGVGVLGSAFQLFLQLLWGGASPGPGLAVLIVVIAVSAFPGVVIGYLLARRLWRKCGTTGIYRRKVVTWHVVIVLLLVFVIQFGFRFMPLPIVVGFGVGFFAALSTTVLGIVWFELREGCRFWYGPVPTRLKPEWIEVRAVRLPRGAPR